MKNTKNTFFKKYMRNIVITIIGVFFIVGVVYAGVWDITNRTSTVTKLHCPSNISGDCFKIDNGTKVSYDTGIDCKTVNNSHGTNKYFVPTKTSNEWNNFKSHLPSGASILEECYMSTSYSEANSRWHTKPNTDHIDICIHGRCRNWYTNDYNTDGVTLLRKHSSYYVPANSSNWEVKRGSLHHNGTDTRRFYYIIER